MDTPNAAAVRTALPTFDWADRGYPEGDPDPLEGPVLMANAYVSAVTARPLDSTMPSALSPLASQAVALRTAQQVVQLDPDYIGSVNDDSLASMSIGPYSETRRDPTKSPSKGALILNQWPALNDILWLLLGLAPGEVNDVVSDKYDYWIAQLTGLIAPAWSFVEMDWTNGLTHDWFGGSSWGLPPPIPIVPD